MVESTSIMLVMTRRSAAATAAVDDMTAFEAKRLSDTFLMVLIIGKQHITAMMSRYILLMRDILSCTAIKPFLPNPKAVLKNVPSFPISSK